MTDWQGGPIHWALDADKLTLILPIIARETDVNVVDKVLFSSSVQLNLF